MGRGEETGRCGDWDWHSWRRQGGEKGEDAHCRREQRHLSSACSGRECCFLTRTKTRTTALAPRRAVEARSARETSALLLLLRQFRQLGVERVQFGLNARLTPPRLGAPCTEYFTTAPPAGRRARAARPQRPVLNHNCAPQGRAILVFVLGPPRSRTVMIEDRADVTAHIRRQN